MAVALPLIGAMVGGAVLSKVMAPKSPTQQVAEKPQVMPMADDEAVKRAQRASMMQQVGRGGRSSTMLSGESETLGG